MCSKFIVIFLIPYLTFSNAFLWRYNYQKNIENIISFDNRFYSSSATEISSETEYEEDYKVRYFPQKLDHFDSNNSVTWNQRYFVKNSFYVKGGPVFIFIEGENSANENRIHGGKWIELGEDEYALCFVLEHRYYGKSRPKRDTRTENLKFLTTNQTLADIAHFIDYIKIQYDLPKYSKFILFGGSYGGNLVAWMRMKYPNIVDGAVSSSAPVLAKVNFLGYFEVVKNVLNSYDPKCVKNFITANEKLVHLLEYPSGREEVKKMFKFCNIIRGNKKDKTTVVGVLADNIAHFVQFNDILKIMTNDTISISNFCKIMTTSDLPMIERYAKFNNIMLKQLERSCWEHDYAELIKYYKNTTYDEIDQSIRLWLYQTCLEYGYFQTSENPEDLLGTNVPLNFYLKLCMDVFGQRFNNKTIHDGINYINAEYEGLNYNISNVAFIHGTNDPWHLLGVAEKKGNSRCEVILIRGGSHCSDMFSLTERDSKEKQIAHQNITDIVNSWIHS